MVLKPSLFRDLSDNWYYVKGQGEETSGGEEGPNQPKVIVSSTWTPRRSELIESLQCHEHFFD